MDNFDKYKKLVDKYLDEFLEIKYPERIWESMRYSVLADGKRLRPVLTLEACRICGGDIFDALPTACAIEMLHAQSLIHDDLPCMDDDDLRRGRPSNHRAFDEATAVLAGDALLSFAPEVIITKTPSSVPDKVKLEVLEAFLVAAGVHKLIAGQVVDIQSAEKKISKETLDFIHKNKTSALFELSLYCGAKLARAAQDKVDILQKYAQNLGLAFQIYDDIIDITATTEELGKTAGKDKQAGKSTYPELYGLEESKNKVSELCKEAREAILHNGLESSLLGGILDIIEDKVKK